jgi:phosphonate transport system ATP-binding protein
LSVAAGKAVAVIGPSGAGKTTLLELLACALRPEAGRLLLDGVDPWALPRRELQRLRGRLFLAPQVPPLPPRQRVVTAVLAGRLPAQSLAASLRSLAHATDAGLARDALARFDLGDKLFERVDRLAGGERQRVALARALLSPARLWLIDEPLSALDPRRANQATAALVAEASARGITLVATLHQVDMALAHFPRIVGLRDGAVAFDLPTAAVTPPLLEQLYAQRDGEPPPAAPDLPGWPALVTACR